MRYPAGMRAVSRFGITLGLTLVFATALASTACRDGGEPKRTNALPAGEAARVLIDRNWLDVWPATERDHLFVYRFTPAMGGGVFQDRTLFKGTFELFRFQTDGSSITFDLPETGEMVKTAFTIERVDGPEPFDLRLTLATDPRGPRTYFGRSAETANAADALLMPLPAPPSR
jgi:hypothetical protein